MVKNIISTLESVTTDLADMIKTAQMNYNDCEICKAQEILLEHLIDLKEC